MDFCDFVFIIFFKMYTIYCSKTSFYHFQRPAFLESHPFFVL